MQAVIDTDPEIEQIRKLRHVPDVMSGRCLDDDDFKPALYPIVVVFVSFHSP